MRQLHPVGWKERFVAAGIYVHEGDQGPTGAVEQWTIHELPDGAQITRVDRQGAHRDDVLLIEAWRAPDGRIERFDLQAYRRKDQTPARVRASYHLFPNRAQYTRRLDDGPEQPGELALPDGALVDPGATVFRGEIIALAALVGRAPVVSVDDAGFFEPIVGEAASALVGGESIVVGAETFAGRVYNVEWMAGERDAVWLDDGDVVLRQRGALTIHLTQYVRRPESTQP